jgi:microcystin-dependent protein
MSCSNCFNGCVEITSDKCVRYTGEDIPQLGISNGDPLINVEQSIIQFILSISTGSTIFPTITSLQVCAIVQNALPAVGPYTLDNYLSALIDVSCALDSRLTAVEGENNNTPYDLQCLLASPTDTSNTHEVLQIVINRLCLLIADQSAFEAIVDATYVKISDINTYIENYLATQPNQQLISNRMAPYSITGYAGPLSNFDASGAGIGDWDKIYLCNGFNGTLDLRGRVLVGTTSGMGGAALNNAVKPGINGNPGYVLGESKGSNQVILNENELPSHGHTASTNPVPDHVHGFENPVPSISSGLGSAQRLTTASDINSIDITETEPAGTHSHGVTVNPTGGNQGHDNYQPGTGVYYIIYIP